MLTNIAVGYLNFQAQMCLGVRQKNMGEQLVLCVFSDGSGSKPPISEPMLLDWVPFTGT